MLRHDMRHFMNSLSMYIDADDKENALNAQRELTEVDRSIKLSMKTANNKLLLSVRNPYATMPVFVDGLPVAGKKGHGYGTQSIRYMTERMGGNCRFAVEGDEFVVRVAL